MERTNRSGRLFVRSLFLLVFLGTISAMLCIIQPLPGVLAVFFSLLAVVSDAEDGARSIAASHPEWSGDVRTALWAASVIGAAVIFALHLVLVFATHAWASALLR
ncbi:MAG: hypothetical protein K2Y21_04575 [Phycisphaerales bacterium]|nr:hypothetical protein [Phycisphaerales bacterium]